MLQGGWEKIFRAYNMRLADLLPLFPLDLVLFPETPLPLHIFEPRYREMIGECLREKREFGVIRALVDQTEDAADETGRVKHRLADCGCTAEIIDVLRTYPDGRMDILVAGRRRFEVIAVDDSRSFFRGEVRFVKDEPATSHDRKLQKTALEQHYQLMLMTSTEAPSLDEKSEVLSF